MLSTIIACAATVLCATDPAAPSQTSVATQSAAQPQASKRVESPKASPQTPQAAAPAEKKANPQVHVTYRPQTEPSKTCLLYTSPSPRD